MVPGGEWGIFIKESLNYIICEDISVFIPHVFESAFIEIQSQKIEILFLILFIGQILNHVLTYVAIGRCIYILCIVLMGVRVLYVWATDSSPRLP